MAGYSEVGKTSLLVQFDQGRIHRRFILCYCHHWLHSEYASWQHRTVWAATGCQSQTPLDVITSHLGESSITSSIPVQLFGFGVMFEMDKEWHEIWDLIWPLGVITVYKAELSCIIPSDCCQWSSLTTRFTGTWFNILIYNRKNSMMTSSWAVIVPIRYFYNTFGYSKRVSTLRSLITLIIS